uniref:Uncharacterized protein n=1 Tax=Tanacetum cinerariifolium TaxID=118510 RepID=A0A699HNP8_TANCI|nr:hypothetical protein [Tanacetum cinerariifolium]
MSTFNFAEVHNMIAFLLKPTESYCNGEEYQWRGITTCQEMANHTRIYASPSHTKKIFENIKRKPRKTRRQVTELPQTSVPTKTVADEDVNEEINNSLERATTTANSLDAEQDKGNISKTQSKETPNEPSSLGTSSGGGPKRQDTMGIPLLRLETTKTAQAKEIANLKKRVKRLERKRKSRSHWLKRLYKVGLCARVESSVDEESLGGEDGSKQGRISDIDANQDIYLVNVHRDEDIFGVNDPDDTSMFDANKDLQGEEVVVEKEVTGKDTRALKNKSFVEIQDLLNKAMKRVNMFVDMDTEVMKSTKKDKAETIQTSSSKRARDELEQESSKKQKIEDENESTELKRCLEIVPDDGDEVTIDATPLSTKSPTIVDYKIYK